MSTHAARMAGIAPIGFRLADRSFTYRCDDGQITVEDGVDGAAAVISLREDHCTALLDQARTFVNLHLAGDLSYERGNFSALVEWDPLIKLKHCGIPIYNPGRVDLGALDLQRIFTLADSDEEIRDFLTTTGYAHLRAVFTRDEIAALNAEIDRLAADAAPGDQRSWWVTDAEAEQRLCRLVYTGHRSPLIAEVESDARLSRLGRIIDANLRVAADRMEGTSVLLKVPGRTVGLSNIPWHQDCGMGGHTVCCPSVHVGIQITGSTAESGNLLVLPGSHGQAVHYDWQKRYSDAPIVAVDTEPGDVTVHIGDLMHASPEPTGAGGRRTMYVTFYPPTLWDRVGPGEAFNDLVRNRAAETAALQNVGRASS